MESTERIHIDELRHRLTTFDITTSESEIRHLIKQARWARGGTDKERVELQLEGLRQLRTNRFPTRHVMKFIFFNDDASFTQTVRAFWIGRPRFDRS